MNDDTNNNLTPEQIKAAQHLASGMSQTEAAEAVGVERNTVWRWTREEAFAAYLDGLKTALVQEGEAALIAGVHGAVNLLVKCVDLDFPIHPTSVGVMAQRIKAAESILDRSGLPKVTREERTGKGGEPEEVNVYVNDLDRRINRLAALRNESGSAGGDDGSGKD